MARSSLGTPSSRRGTLAPSPPSLISARGRGKIGTRPNSRGKFPMSLRPFLWIAIIAGCVGPVAAQEKNWVGEAVFPKKPADTIKITVIADGKAAEFDHSGKFPNTVRDERDGKL